MHDPRNGHLLAALNHGHFGVKLQRSTDGGATWHEVPAPKYPDKPEGYTPKTPVEGTPAEWALKLVWALAPGGADEPGVIWCGTLPGGLFRSDDGGESWSLNRPLWDDPRREEWFGGGADHPGIHSVLVDPRDSRHVKVGVSCGGVWTTRDGGASWEPTATGMRAEFMPPERQFEPNVQDPHMVAQCRANPDVLWVQHHNGIFKSVDGARSWTEITGVQPSTFGFAVAAHPRDEGTAWFVPAVKDETRYPAGGRVVVTRTRDGGQTLRDAGDRAAAAARLRPGLPPRPRRGRDRPGARLRLDHRRAVVQRRRRRLVADGVVPSSAHLRRAIRAAALAAAPASFPNFDAGQPIWRAGVPVPSAAGGCWGG